MSRYSLFVLMGLALAGCSMFSSAPPPRTASGTGSEARAASPMAPAMAGGDHMTPGPGSIAAQMQALGARPEPGSSDSLSATTFRKIVESVAHEIAAAPAFQDAKAAPTVALGDFHNLTSLNIDRNLMLESIRAATIATSGGKIMFRDDTSYAAIVEERARQSTTAATSERNGWRAGENSMHYEHRVAVDGRVAEAKLILGGSLFQLHERDAMRPNYGLTYHQFHFRLVDVRSGMILWEKVVGLVTEGAIVEAPMLRAASTKTGAAEESGAGATGFASRLGR